MDTPFPYDRVPNSKEFYGRDVELHKLEEIVGYGNNLLLFSKRRMGKTALCRHFLELQKDFITIYVDIFDIATKEDFAHALLKALSNAQKQDIKSVIKKLAGLFKRVRIEPSIDTNTLEYTIKPVVATLSFEEMMEDFFQAVESLAKEQKVIIAIDEFQQIATINDIKLDAYLRRFIQERHNTSYLFLGSKRHLLTSLFAYKAPLYEMATHLELGGLDVVSIFSYARKYLEIDETMVEYLYRLSDGETKIVQNILHLLYLQKELPVTKELIDKALEEIVSSRSSSYRLLFDTLSNNQKIALKIIGKYKKGVFTTPILTEYNIKKQTLQSALEALLAKELVDKEGDSYFIPDRTLELWSERL